MTNLSGKLTVYAIMFVVKPQFKDLFKKFRLRSGFATLSEFGKALTEEGLVFEDSLFSRWQRGSRIPKERNTLLTIIRVFIEHGGINILKEANFLLELAGQGYLTESERRIIKQSLLPIETRPPKEILDFTILIGKSKKILRSGWVREKVKKPESVAEHSFRLSVLTMVLSNQFEVNREKLIQMALIHNLGGVITRDLVWARGKLIDYKKQEIKEKIEKVEVEKIFRLIGISNQYVDLYKEMVERKTEEAKIFWQIDKLEMAIQALEYEKSDNKNLEEFFINADLQIHSPFLKKIMKEILKQRNKKK